MLSEKTKGLIESFLKTTELPGFYRQYDWKNDHWHDGFREIRALEGRLSAAARTQSIARSHILSIAEWGGLPDTGRIRCYSDPLAIPLYDGAGISAAVKSDPVLPVRMIKQQTSGIGPTYISKVLRFTAPAVFGAIDSRLVRVFGTGDEKSKTIQILNLRAGQAAGGRWFIGPENWPDGYGTWIAILNDIAATLNSTGIICPHPDQFVSDGLRQRGIWWPADVEMALFSFASRRIYGR
ncbi:MAG: hypothetical protein STSR0009_01780 [Methanoregula sp.]